MKERRRSERKEGQREGEEKEGERKERKKEGKRKVLQLYVAKFKGNYIYITLYVKLYVTINKINLMS